MSSSSGRMHPSQRQVESCIKVVGDNCYQRWRPCQRLALLLAYYICGMASGSLKVQFNATIIEQTGGPKTLTIRHDQAEYLKIGMNI